MRAARADRSCSHSQDRDEISLSDQTLVLDGLRLRAGYPFPILFVRWDAGPFVLIRTATRTYLAELGMIHRSEFAREGSWYVRE